MSSCRATNAKDATIGVDATIGKGARVGEYVFVGESATVNVAARIGACARIGDGARIGKCATLGEYVVVGWGARVLPYTCWNVSPYYAICGRWPAYDAGGGHFGVGCQVYPIARWLARLDPIAEEHEATDLEKALARHALNMVCLLRGIEATP